MTWSARSSNEGGIVSLSALAVLRFTASSNVVGCSTGSSSGIVAVHARAIRAVADRDTTVGKSLLAVCLPRVAIERSENSMMIVLGPRHRTARGSVYLPSDSTEVIQYAPNFVCGIGLIRGSGGPRNE
jgi:hypothetical protein